MELTYSSETSADFQRTKWCYIPEDKPLQTSFSYILRLKLFNDLALSPSAIMFPAALYGCETRSLTLQDEHSLRVFENSVLREVSQPLEGRSDGRVEKIA
jgi:hypothetical protein